MRLPNALPGLYTNPACGLLFHCTVVRNTLVNPGWGCQKSIARQVIDQEADYVLALTQNQPQLYDQATAMFTYERSTNFRNCPHDFHQTVEKGHGRIETRRCGRWRTPHT